MATPTTFTSRTAVDGRLAKAGWGLLKKGREIRDLLSNYGTILDEITAAVNGVEPDSATVQTTDATETSLWTETLADETAYAVEAMVVARDTSGSGRAAYKLRALVYREGGAATLQGSVHTDWTEESDAAWAVTIDVDTNDVRLRVTGKAATTIAWSAEVDYQAISTV